MFSRFMHKVICVEPVITFRHNAVNISTPRLILRPIQASDINFLVKDVYSDPAVMQWYRYGPSTTEEQIRKYAENSIEVWDQGSLFGTFIVVENETNTPLGEVAIVEDAPGKAEIFYAFARRAQGKGYASEAIKAVGIDYAFKLFQERATIKGQQLTELVATVHPENAASEVILKDKLGMEYREDVVRFGAPRKLYGRSLGI